MRDLQSVSPHPSSQPDTAGLLLSAAWITRQLPLIEPGSLVVGELKLVDERAALVKQLQVPCAVCGAHGGAHGYIGGEICPLFLDLQKEWRALDDYTAANWQPGDTKIRLRESIRYVSTAQPYGGRWLDTKLDGSNATCIPDDIFIGELQRRNGLHLSQCRSTVTRALELGDTVGGAKDYHGDWFLNNAARRRPHDGVLRAWYDCVHAVSVSRPVMGDAEKPELTKQFNEGYKTDLAEPGEVHPREGPGRTVLVELDQHLVAGESFANYDAAGLAAARVVRPYDSDGGADARLHSAPQYRTPRAAKRTAPPRSLAVAGSM